MPRIFPGFVSEGKGASARGS